MTAISAAEAPPAPVIRPVNPADYRPAMLNVGVIVWLASELMFFSGLFAAFFALRAATPIWPPHGDTLDVTPVLIATLFLVISSGTMQYAVKAAMKGDKVGFLGWIALTFALGALFDGMQMSDWAGRPFPIDQNAYTSCFYVLTGFHALHVLGGLFGMVLMAIRVKKTKNFGHRTAPAVEMLSYYWHFVDVVWIVMFLSIFVLK
ncbi:MAG: heme-copper oxidase subunit III [Acidimicrobiaceae bacterium]|nr:heme-copper oxidase subunit III [Acidimicrobiaceae bacterium]